MNKCVMLVLALATSACGRAHVRQVYGIDWDNSCTREQHWWLEAPSELLVGEETAAQLGYCVGWGRPQNISWRTSNKQVLAIVASDSDHVTIKAITQGVAKLIADSRKPPGRSALLIVVKSQHNRAAGR